MRQNYSQEKYNNVAYQIIKQQELVIGPVAWEEAKKVSGLSIKGSNVQIKGDVKKVLEALVNQYATLFGRASIEVCKDAVKGMVANLNNKDLPAILL